MTSNAARAGCCCSRAIPASAGLGSPKSSSTALATGLGGRPRRVGDPAERARKAVSGRIRLAIARLESEHPPMARQLHNAVRTGTYCAYEPETDTIWHT